MPVITQSPIKFAATPKHTQQLNLACRSYYREHFELFEVDEDLEIHDDVNQLEKIIHHFEFYTKVEDFVWESAHYNSLVATFHRTKENVERSFELFAQKMDLPLIYSELYPGTESESSDSDSDSDSSTDIMGNPIWSIETAVLRQFIMQYVGQSVENMDE